MSGRFVRASKYRHVFGQASKKENCYDNLRISKNAWDSNIVKANSKFISVNWESSGGGAFAVIPVNEVGKAPDVVPLFRGHTSAVLDTDFNPFNDRMIASSSDDGKIAIWEIPEDYSFFNYTDIDGEPKAIKPVKKLSGHLRKVGHIKFHPMAENILVSSSNDYSVKVWNIETGKPILSLQHKDLVTSFCFSYDGNRLATTSRDKTIRVWDLRTGSLLQEGKGHAGAKNPRCVWLGTADRIATTGFSRLSDRQIGIWDASDLQSGPIGGFINIDSSAGILMPFFDDSTNMLYIAGKGDGNIRYYEYTPQDDELYDISEFQSIDPQRGFAMAPKKAVNVKETEILRAYKTVKDTYIEPISFIVPRRAEMFQFDLYPDAPAGVPALTTEEWLAGKTAPGPVLFNMESLYDDDVEVVYSSGAPSAPAPKAAAAVAPKAATTPKEEAKPEAKPEVKSASPVASPVKTTSVDGLLAKKEVTSLLDKSKDIDAHNNVTVPETNDENDEFAPQFKADALEPKAEAKPVAASVVVPPLAKPVIAKPNEEPKEAPKEALKEAPKEAEPAAKIEEAKPAAKGGATLKATVERLALLVDKLEAQISILQAENATKDAKLEQIEAKLDKLSK